jgi:proteasome lid subunit RPN8/RPN11
MFSFLMQETKEVFICLHLDGKNRIICMDLVSIGTLNQSLVHTREFFKTACLSNAAAIICVHQHPSGDPGPSSEDISITRRLKEAIEIWVLRYWTISLSVTVNISALWKEDCCNYKIFKTKKVLYIELIMALEWHIKILDVY